MGLCLLTWYGLLDLRTHNPQVAGSNPAPATIYVNNRRLLPLSFTESSGQIEKSHLLGGSFDLTCSSSSCFAAAASIQRDYRAVQTQLSLVYYLWFELPYALLLDRFVSHHHSNLRSRSSSDMGLKSPDSSTFVKEQDQHPTYSWAVRTWAPPMTLKEVKNE